MQAIKSQNKSILKALFSLIFLLISYSALYGQASEKRLLTTEDYHLWSFLVPGKISVNGNWVSYCLRYEYTGKDTITVKQTYGDKKYVFPGSASGKFNGETDFAFLKGDTLIVQNLKTGTLYKRTGVINFEFSGNEKFIVIFVSQPNGKLGLEIRDRVNNVLQNILDITYYCFDPAKSGVVYSIVGNNGNKVEAVLFDNSNLRKTVAESQNAPFQGLVWKGNSIAFVENFEADPRLFTYNMLTGVLNTLTPKNVKGFPVDMKISNSIYRKPIISKDGSKIVLWLKENQLNPNFTNDSTVQVWNTGDRQLFASKKFFGDYRFSDKMAIWDLQKNTIVQLTNKKLPSGFLSADYNYAFIYDKNAYEPQTQQHGAYDLHLVDLKNGERKSIIEKYVFGDQIPSRSPDGHYLCYSKKGHWWIYDVQKDCHTNITMGLPISFVLEDRDMPGEDEPYGVGGWTKDGEVILYDRYDLWKISLDGKVKIRLTKGREVQKVFRIENSTNPFDVDVEANGTDLDLGKGFLLKVANKEIGETGLSFWSSKLGLKELVWGDKRIEQVSKARDKDIYMYVDQNFQLAPGLIVYDGKPKQMMRSNAQQKSFYWSKNERIEYTVDGKKMKGILFYPANYDADLKYPMVVHIYERQFAYFNIYENPSLLDPLGFNVQNFTAQGYFVLYPDISYEYGNLKKSVTNSVLAAVDTALKRANINPFKVGLEGSSFGGYETDLIITQTDRFATAVAGLAWSDLVSGYLYIGEMFRRPDFFRAENHQYRIGKSLFENMPAYLNNSPVLSADKVRTPLLGWTGEDDRHVNALQSMEFYLALRRAKKEHTLLVYPGEGHGLGKRKNAIDLNTRVMQWFDYYLKNGKRQDWMNSDYVR